MPRKTDPLTDQEIRAARFDGKPRKMFDGAGLFLLVTQTGKYWRLKYRYAGKERTLSLGVYPSRAGIGPREAGGGAPAPCSGD